MTAILLALLAAVGIGGGIAAVSGGSDGDSGPQAPMSVISTLAEADRYKNVLAYSNDSYGSGLENIQFGSEKIVGQMEVPVVRDGYFAQRYYSDNDGSYIDAETTHQYVEFTKDHYQKTDEYADYFTQKVGSWSGKLDDRETIYEPVNYIDLTVNMESTLALGGRVAGLENAEFGYHKETATYNTGDPDHYYGSFYAYDQTRLADLNRSDVAYYKGNVLGSMSQTDENDYLLSRALAGTADFTLDFAHRSLSGSLTLNSEGKDWHKFSVSGDVNDDSSFTLTSASQSGVLPDDIRQWGFESLDSSFGQGKVLDDELVGDLSLSGNSYYDNSLYAYLVYGARDVTAPIAPEDNSASNNSNSNSQPDYSYNTSLMSPMLDASAHKNVLVAGVKRSPGLYDTARELDLLEGYSSSDPRDFVLTTAFPKKNGSYFERLTEYSDWGGRIYYIEPAEEQATWNVSDFSLNISGQGSSSGGSLTSSSVADIYTLQHSDSGYFNSSSSPGVSGNTYNITVTQTEELALGGNKLGLSAGDFGYWKEKREGFAAADEDLYDYDTFSPFVMYNQDLLYSDQRSDKLTFAGWALYDGGSANFNMDINFANDSLLGYTSASTDGEHNFSFAGSLDNKNVLYFTDLNDLSASSFQIGGTGYLLKGKDGLETVGTIYLHSLMEYMPFGAKEVK